MKKSLFVVTAILVSLFLLVSCASGSKKAVAKEEPMKVTNTEPKPASTKTPDTNGTTAKPAYIDSGIDNINESGRTVTDDSANQDKKNRLKTFFEIEQKLDDYFAHCTVEIILDEAGYEINWEERID